VEKIAAEAETVELNKVYLVADGEEVTIGNPIVEGAKVIADIVDEGKRRKVLVFKYKPKTRYRRKKGHRQPYTRLTIREIVTG